MSPTFWISLASFSGFLFVQTATIAFFLGSLSSQVKTLKDAPHEDCKAELSGVNATLTAMQRDLAGMERRTSERFDSLEHTVREYVANPPRARAAARG